MKGVILSGGLGTRLRPFSYSLAKQLIPIANKPVLFYLIEKLVDVGVNEIGIVVGDTKEMVIREVGDGSQWNAKITYLFQDKPLGLADAVNTARDFTGKEDFIVLLGDNLLKEEFGSFIYRFKINKMDAQIHLYRVKDPSRYGVAVLDEEGRIERLIEKPKDFVSNYAITGIYIFSKSIFDAIENIKPSARGELEITDAIQYLLLNGYKVGCEFLKDWWIDIGTPQDVLEANRKVLSDLSYYVHDGIDLGSITGIVNISDKAVIINSKIRGPVIIGDGCHIENSYVGPYTSIGNNVFIQNCEVENSILFNEVTIRNIDFRIDVSIIGKKAIIEKKDLIPRANSFFLGNNDILYFTSD